MYIRRPRRSACPKHSGPETGRCGQEWSEALELSAIFIAQIVNFFGDDSRIPTIAVYFTGRWISLVTQNTHR
jgi:hypothetical protein